MNRTVMFPYLLLNHEPAYHAVTDLVGGRVRGAIVHLLAALRNTKELM